MFDCHIHTNFSTDSSMNIEEVIKASRNNNIGAIITDHLDINYMIPGKFIFNVDDYFKKYSSYRNEKLLLGIEMGMRPDCIEENREISKKYNFDFILGSVHVVESNGSYYDIYGNDFYEGKNKKEVYEAYLKCMLQCVREHDYIDSLSHIDYICRYAPYSDSNIYYDEYNELIDEILKELILREKAIEINTRRFEDKKAVAILKKIYKRFNELGGKIVTIGSDAHRSENVDNNIHIAKEFAEECGLKAVYFKERKPIVLE